MALFSNASSFSEKSFGRDTSEVVDTSAKYPVLFFTLAATLWLAASSVFAFINALQEINGTFLSQWEWFTYGRVNAVVETLFIYGWCGNAIFATGLWVMARLCRKPLFGRNIIFIAGLFWNGAVKIALFGILFRGDLTGIPRLEMPAYAAVIATLSAIVIFACGILTFSNRNEVSTFASQWYLLAAFLIFPWLMTTAVLMRLIFPVPGTIQAIVEAWFAYSIFGLWLTPVALAMGYYLIPKILGKTISAYSFTAIGFWTLLCFNSWAGIYTLSGGPVPAWLATTGIAANLCFLLPLAIISLNYYQTLQGSLKTVLSNVVLRFIFAGIIALTLFYTINALASLRIFSASLKFTYFAEGLRFHGLYAFFSMMLFGTIYFMLSSVTRQKKQICLLKQIHFFASLTGATIVVASLLGAGWIQGIQLNLFEKHQPVYTFGQVLEHIAPWLKLRLVGLAILIVGHLVFVTYLIVTLLKTIRTDLKEIRFSPHN